LNQLSLLTAWCVLVLFCFVCLSGLVWSLSPPTDRDLAPSLFVRYFRSWAGLCACGIQMNGTSAHAERPFNIHPLSSSLCIEGLLPSVLQCLRRTCCQALITLHAWAVCPFVHPPCICICRSMCGRPFMTHAPPSLASRAYQCTPLTDLSACQAPYALQSTQLGA